LHHCLKEFSVIGRASQPKKRKSRTEPSNFTAKAAYILVFI
jgi:hypothetical protein